MDQLSLLLVDDDEQLCEIISTYLELEGFTVKAVHRADSFRNALARSHFDLVIVDLNLPDASGLDLVVELDERGDAGIIVLTGSDQKVDKISVSNAVPMTSFRNRSISVSYSPVFAACCADERNRPELRRTPRQGRSRRASGPSIRRGMKLNMKMVV